MEGTTGGKLLPANLERDLRRLQFTDPRLEEQYRQTYAENARVHLRLVLAVTLVIPVAGFLASSVGGSAQQGGTGVWVLVIHVAALMLTWSPWFSRLFQGMMATLCVVGALTVIVDLLPSPEAVNPLLVAALYTYTLFRLRFGLAVVVYWAITAAYLALAIWRYQIPIATVSRGFPGMLIANLMGMAAAFTLESWSRRDFLLTQMLQREHEKSEQLLLNILPRTVAQRLKDRPVAAADDFPDVTVLFADIVDFTSLSSALTAAGTVTLLNEVFSCFDGLADRHGLEKIKTIGDAYMVVGGLPETRGDHAAAVMAMAVEMQREIGRYRGADGLPLRLRIGIHTGPVAAGVIGTRRFSYDLWGDTVNLASRMESCGLPGAIQVTDIVYERLKSRYGFEARHLEGIKGKGDMTAYLLRVPGENGTGGVGLSDSPQPRPALLERDP